MFTMQWPNLLYCTIFAILIFRTLPLYGKNMHPLVFMPGFQGSRMMAEIAENADLNQVDRCRKNVGSKPFTVWESFIYETTHPFQCVNQALTLDYDNATRTTKNRRGVKIKPSDFGTIDGFDYVVLERISGPYFIYIVDFFRKRGYRDNKTIFGAPYDFRRGASEQRKFFAKYKILIEKAYTKSGNLSVIIIPHSLGGTYTLLFLLQQTQEWKDKYIKCVIFMAPAIGGGPKILHDIFTGDYYDGADTTVIPPPVGEKGFTCFLLSKNPSNLIFPGSVLATYSSVPHLIPSPAIWNTSTVLIQADTKSYSLSNIRQFFRDFKFNNLMETYEDNYKYLTKVRFPNVTTHCIYGSKVPTIQEVIVRGRSSPYNVTARTGDGDGEVNAIDMKVCRNWMRESNGKNVTLKVFPGVDHDAILGNQTVLNYVGLIVDNCNNN